MTDRDEDSWSRRFVPNNKLEVDVYTTEPAWGTDAINPDLKEYLRRVFKFKFLNDDGVLEEGSEREDMWAILGMYTKDIRLSFLKEFEVEQVRHFCRLASFCLKHRFLQSFLFATNEIASIVETSAGRKGNLRNNMTTTRQEATILRNETDKVFNKNKGDRE